MKAAVKIDDDVRDVLRRSTVQEQVVYLPAQLDRKLYERVNKVLGMLGGAWNRAARGHVFASNPHDALAAALDDGQVAHPNALEFFRSSRGLAEIVCLRLGAERHHRILEPSAGEGDLLAPLMSWLGRLPVENLVLYELDSRHFETLRSKGLGEHLIPGDFLAQAPPSVLFDRILMNPPFHVGTDAKHIGHALEFLAPGGRLVAIASSGFKSRDTNPTKEVRAKILAWGGTIEKLPEGSFKQAGTNVATVLVTVDRPKERAPVLSPPTRARAPEPFRPLEPAAPRPVEIPPRIQLAFPF